MLRERERERDRERERQGERDQQKLNHVVQNASNMYKCIEY